MKPYVIQRGNTEEPRPTLEEDLLYQNIQLLGLASTFKGKDVEFSKTMFRKPNPKGLNATLYHLYIKIKGGKLPKNFKNAWPETRIMDPKQQKDFHQLIVDWLQELRTNNGFDPSTAATTLSSLRSATGQRLVSTLLDLSSYALELELSENSDDYKLCPKAWKESALPELLPAAMAASRARCSTLTDSWLKLLSRGAAATSGAEAAASQLREAYYSTEETYITLKKKLNPSLEALFEEQLDDLEGWGIPSDTSKHGQVRSSTTSISRQQSDKQQHAPLHELLEKIPDMLTSQLEAGAYKVLSGKWQAANDALDLSKKLADALTASGIENGGAHPYAVDVAKLAGAAGMEVGEGNPGPPLLALLEQWVEGVEAASDLAHALAPRPSGKQGTHALLAAADQGGSHAAHLSVLAQEHEKAAAQLTAGVEVIKKAVADTEHKLEQVLACLPVRQEVHDPADVFPSIPPSLHAPPQLSTGSSGGHASWSSSTRTSILEAPTELAYQRAMEELLPTLPPLQVPTISVALDASRPADYASVPMNNFMEPVHPPQYAHPEIVNMDASRMAMYPMQIWNGVYGMDGPGMYGNVRNPYVPNPAVYPGGYGPGPNVCATPSVGSAPWPTRRLTYSCDASKSISSGVQTVQRPLQTPSFSTTSSPRAGGLPTAGSQTASSLMVPNIYPGGFAKFGQPSMRQSAGGGLMPPPPLPALYLQQSNSQQYEAQSASVSEGGAVKSESVSSESAVYVASSAAGSEQRSDESQSGLELIRLRYRQLSNS